MARASLLRSGSALSLLTLVSRVLGLFREMTKAALLGTGALSDAFSVAFMLPNLFRRLFAEGSIAVAFIPTFKEYLLDDHHSEIKEFLCCFWTFLSFFVSIAVALGIALAPFIVPVFGIDALDETVLLTRVMFPFLLFISVAAFFQGILNSIHVFVPSALAPIILNVVTIAASWLLSPYTKNPARAMAIGIFIGGFLEAAIQLPFILKKGFSFSWVPLIRAIRSPGTKKVLRLIGPTIIGMAAYQLNDVVSTALAGGAGNGVVSSLQYSLRLQELILGVFAVSLGTVLLPDLAEKAKTQHWEEYNKRLSDAVSIIALITIPLVFFALAAGESLIRLLFQSREFDEQSVALTLSAFTFHISGLFFIAVNRILAPAFYAQSDSVSPTLAGLISFAVNILLAFALVGPMKGGGIALALSIAGFVNTMFLFLFFRKNKNIRLKPLLHNSSLYVIKIIMISIAAMCPLLFISPFTRRFISSFNISNRLWTQAVPLTVHFLIFAAIALFLLILTRDKYIKTIFALFKKDKKTKQA
ncbi:MAG: murein biosynthesis integral membrane protein MurJ [Spirochaetaceae bacterium]|jgi:putative peptidoglycan lipid II flippase|nr:murein biosynthesis integral membrane protein MurJ [Spirochaetaceae bacterium]